MQNSKNRMILLAIVVLALPGIALWNALSAPRDGSDQARAQGEEQKLETAKVSENQRKSATEELKGALRNNPVETFEEGAKPASLVKNPSILVPRLEAVPPRPNDATAATHWYRPDSRSAKKAAENARQRQGA